MSDASLPTAILESPGESEAAALAAHIAMRTGDAFRRRMLAMLARLRGCVLTMVEPQARFTLGEPLSGEEPLRATVTVHDTAMYRCVALGGSVGVGESYMDGLWDCDDLTALVRIFVRNRDLLDSMETGLARLGGAVLRFLHARQRNSRAGSRRNIAAHYDLGNEFFALFLDENLMYSSAIFADESESLEVASRRKLDRVCDKLQLHAGDRVIEIGSGWGGFALHAAARHGCHVTTATISREQFERARERVRTAGLEDRITVLLSDYRDLAGRYDKLVSIEMVEGIGHQYLDTYFAKCAALLEPDGMGLLQAITIEDHRYAQALKNVDFIQRFVFPGCFIPSVGALCGAMARASDLKLFHLEDIGPSYAITLRKWRERFFANLDRVRELGYPERFVRMWDYYLRYSEGGFLERSIGDVQMLLVKPGCRRASYLPDTSPA